MTQPLVLTATDTGLIGVRGAFTEVSALHAIPGCTLAASGTSSTARLPVSRLSVMAVESSVLYFEADEAYLDLRRKAMQPSAEQMDRWLGVKRVIRPMLSFQDDFCAFALDSRGVLNASEQGTGKTTMAAALVHAWCMMYGYSRVMLVGPRSPLMQWERELVEVLGVESPLFVPLLQSVSVRNEILEGLSSVDDYIMVATNYDSLERMEFNIRRYRPQVLVFDESWKVKNPSAAMTKSACRIADYAEKVLCLNGTPVSTHAGDLWSQLRIVTGPGVIGSHKEWKNEFVNSGTFSVEGARGEIAVTQYSGVKNIVQMMTRMAPHYWRATKESCLDLPEKLAPVSTQLQMAGQQATLYDLVYEYNESVFYAANENVDPLDPFGPDWESDMMSAHGLSDAQMKNLSLAGAMTKTLRLQQITSGYLPQKFTYGIPFDGHAHGLRQDPDTGAWHIPSCKDDELEAWLDDNMREDRTVRCIVWCKFNQEVARIQRLADRVLGGGSSIAARGGKGGLKDREFDEVKASFNTRDPFGVRLIVAQTARVAYGHNLQTCDWNIQTSLPWSYLQQDQLEDRSHRLGRVGPVGYIRYLARRSRDRMTVDHDAENAIVSRENLATRIARHTTSLYTEA